MLLPCPLHIFHKNNRLGDINSEPGGTTFVGFNLCYKQVNPFNPEFTIVIFIHYKSRIAVAKMWLKNKENYHVLVNQFHGNFRSKTSSCVEIKYVFRDVR